MSCFTLTPTHPRTALFSCSSYDQSRNVKRQKQNRAKMLTSCQWQLRCRLQKSVFWNNPSRKKWTFARFKVKIGCNMISLFSSLPPKCCIPPKMNWIRNLHGEMSGFCLIRSEQNHQNLQNLISSNWPNWRKRQDFSSRDGAVDIMRTWTFKRRRK